MLNPFASHRGAHAFLLLLFYLSFYKGRTGSSLGSYWRLYCVIYYNPRPMIIPVRVNDVYTKSTIQRTSNKRELRGGGAVGLRGCFEIVAVFGDVYMVTVDPLVSLWVYSRYTLASRVMEFDYGVKRLVSIRSTFVTRPT
jgi:hypothetical protein